MSSRCPWALPVRRATPLPPHVPAQRVDRARLEKVRTGNEQLDRSLKLPGSDEPRRRRYLPELTGHPDPAAVPDVDREAIRAVLAGRVPEAPTPPGLAVPLARLVDTDGFWPERRLPDETYVAQIKVIESDLRLRAGEHRQFHLRITGRHDPGGPGITVDRSFVSLTAGCWTAP